MPDPQLKLDPEPEVLVVRVPGLRGVEISVTVPRVVWLWFQGADHVVGSTAPPALESFRTRTSESAVAFFRQALEAGKPPAEAAEQAARMASEVAVPVEFIGRGAEAAIRADNATRRKLHDVLVQYLVHDPLHRLSVQSALEGGVFPPRLAAAVRTLITTAAGRAAAESN